MNDDQKLLYAILCDFIQQKTSVKGKISQQLVDYANQQSLSAIIYHQTKDERLKSAFYATLIDFEKKQQYQSDVISAFDKAGIGCYCVKGLSVANIYPIPYLRTMGDIDIIIHPGSEWAVRKILHEMGFICLSGERDREMAFQKHGIHIEVHNHLVYDDIRLNQSMFHFGNECWEHLNNHQLEWDWHILYLLIHLQKHIMGEGAGIRQFLDIAMVVKYCSINWKFVIGYLEKMGMMPFAQRVFSFIEETLSVSTPITGYRMSNDDMEIVIDKLFSDGIFGHNNVNNQRNGEINEVEVYGKGLLIKRFFQSIILPKVTLEAIPEYKYLKQSPHMYPLACVLRIVRKLHMLPTKVMELLNYGRYQQQRSDLYSLWGVELDNKQRTKKGISQTN